VQRARPSLGVLEAHRPASLWCGPNSRRSSRIDKSALKDRRPDRDYKLVMATDGNWVGAGDDKAVDCGNLALTKKAKAEQIAIDSCLGSGRRAKAPISSPRKKVAKDSNNIAPIQIVYTHL
jgi:hypothetical protein